MNESSIPIRVFKSIALKAGHKFFFTGKFCANGHLAKRRTCNGTCVVCEEERAEHRRKFYHANKDKERERKRKWRATKPESPKNWRKNNRGLVRSYDGKRRAAKLNATPLWADAEKTKEVYMNCPEGYHVDHIIPLQGENVCGLHIAENLQYLTPSENSSKNNKLIL